MRARPWLTLGALLALSGCADPTTNQESGGLLQAPASQIAGTVTADLGASRQTIDGFGGSNAWTGLPSDAAAQARVVTLLFSPTEGAGLTLIRNRIPFRESTTYDDNFLAKNATTHKYTADTATYPGHRTFTLNWNNWDLANTRSLMAKAKAAAGTLASEIRGFSTPWTPPNNQYDLWKVDGTNNTVGGTLGTAATWPDIGGELSPSHYQDYADVLADYAKGFEANMGYPLAAVSIQNEPNYLPKTYESAWWTAAQFHAFLPSLGSAWTAKGVSTPVILGEGFSFNEALVTDALADEDTAGLFGIVGVHQYSGEAAWLTSTKAAGKKLWMTEDSEGSANDASMADGLEWAQNIHADLTVAEVNAYCYWWLWTNSASPTKGSLLNVNGAVVTENKRLFTLGQYSRFIRPGWVRVQSTLEPATGIQTSVYRNAASTRFAAVIINARSTVSGVKVTLPGRGITSAELYRTSELENLTLVGGLQVAGGNTLSVPLAAASVSTVYGILD